MDVDNTGKAIIGACHAQTQTRRSPCTEPLPSTLHHDDPETQRHSEPADGRAKKTRGRVCENKQIPGHDGLERPDIVVVDETRNTVVIVDVRVWIREVNSSLWTCAPSKYEQGSASRQLLQAKGLQDLGEHSCSRFTRQILYAERRSTGLTGHRSAVPGWSRYIYVENVTDHR